MSRLRLTPAAAEHDGLLPFDEGAVRAILRRAPLALRGLPPCCVTRRCRGCAFGPSRLKRARARAGSRC